MSSLFAVRRRRTVLSSLALAVPASLAALLAASPALAAGPEPEPEPSLGQPGQLVLPELIGVRSGVPQLFAGLANSLSPAVVVADVGWGGVIGYGRTDREQYTHQGSLTSKSTSESESFWFAPAADVFVSRRISVGLAAGFVWSRTEMTTDPTIAPTSYDGFSAAITPRVGYLVPLGHGVSFWPRLGIGGSYAQNTAYSESAQLLQGSASWSFSGGLDLALVYRPTRHLMFKMAPQITVGRTVTEGGVNSTWSTAEGTFVRLGGEATAGLVF